MLLFKFLSLGCANKEFNNTIKKEEDTMKSDQQY